MQGTISFDGTLSGGITGGGGGGSEVTITPVLTEGTKIADYSIDGESGSLYAPTPEDIPDTIVTEVERQYNDTSQTKIMTVKTLDRENNRELSQDIYAPSSGGVNYSTTEQDTGITWIDESHIYQKTVKLENVALTAASFITRNVSDYFSNVNVLISYESIIHNKTANAYYLMPYSLNGNLAPYSANVSIVGNEIDITTGIQFTAATTDIYVTLKYTKSV